MHRLCKQSGASGVPRSTAAAATRSVQTVCAEPRGSWYSLTSRVGGCIFCLSYGTPTGFLPRNAVPGDRCGLFVGELKRIGKCNTPAFKMTRASRTAPNRLRKGRFVPVGARRRPITLERVLERPMRLRARAWVRFDWQNDWGWVAFRRLGQRYHTSRV